MSRWLFHSIRSIKKKKFLIIDNKLIDQIKFLNKFQKNELKALKNKKN